MVRKTAGGIVYSTNPSFEITPAEMPERATVPKDHDLRVQLDKKQRGGKLVTVVSGHSGNQLELEVLAKLLKSKCGVGGGVKDRFILIQGDFRDKILELLLKEGYRAKKAGG